MVFNGLSFFNRASVSEPAPRFPPRIPCSILDIGTIHRGGGGASCTSQTTWPMKTALREARNPEKPSETHRLLAAVIKISCDGCGWVVSTRQTTKFGEMAEQTGFAAISPCCDEKKNTNKGLSRLNVFCSREPRPPTNLLSRVTEDAACSGERRPGQGDSEEVTFSFCLNTFSREAETCLP